MLVLIDTSTPVCRLAVLDSTGELIHHEWESGRQLAKGLLRFLSDCLEKSNSTIKDISGIGVMKGPGSFTGLRIGIAVANTLADGLSVPIVGEVGDDWQKVTLDRLKNGENDRIVLPEYGREAHITSPRK